MLARLSLGLPPVLKPLFARHLAGGGLRGAGLAAALGAAVGEEPAHGLRPGGGSPIYRASSICQTCSLLGC